MAIWTNWYKVKLRRYDRRRARFGDGIEVMNVHETFAEGAIEDGETKIADGTEQVSIILVSIVLDARCPCHWVTFASDLGRFANCTFSKLLGYKIGFEHTAQVSVLEASFAEPVPGLMRDKF